MLFEHQKVDHLFASDVPLFLVFSDVGGGVDDALPSPVALFAITLVIKILDLEEGMGIRFHCA